MDVGRVLYAVETDGVGDVAADGQKYQDCAGDVCVETSWPYLRSTRGAWLLVDPPRQAEVVRRGGQARRHGYARRRMRERWGG